MGYSQLALLEQTLMQEGDTHSMSPGALPVSPPRSIADMQSCHADLISEATSAYGGAGEAFGISSQGKVEL